MRVYHTFLVEALVIIASHPGAKHKRIPVFFHFGKRPQLTRDGLGAHLLRHRNPIGFHPYDRCGPNPLLRTGLAEVKTSRNSTSPLPSAPVTSIVFLLRW